jgi:hypothetical protein
MTRFHASFPYSLAGVTSMKKALLLTLCLLPVAAFAETSQTSAALDSAVQIDASWNRVGPSIYAKTFANGEYVEIGFGSHALKRQLNSLDATRNTLLRQQASTSDAATRLSLSDSLAQVDAAIQALSVNVATSKLEGEITYEDMTEGCNKDRIVGDSVFGASWTAGGTTGSASMTAYAVGVGLVGTVTVTATAANGVYTNFQSVPNVVLYNGQNVGVNAAINNDWDCSLSTSATLVASGCPTRTITRSITCGNIPPNP